MRSVTWKMTGIYLSILAVTLGACSSQTFTNANGDAGEGGATRGGSPGTGGMPASGGRLGTGGTRATSGGSGTGASSAGGNLGSTGGTSASGGASSSDSGVITTDGGVVSSDASTVNCAAPNPTFPTFEKGCTNDASCVLVRHITSCCGSVLVMAINHAELSRFQAAESVCDAQYPGCRCASPGVSAEDGTLVPVGSENLIVASCDNGICGSHYSGKTFPCGTVTCTDQQYCQVFSGGPAGSTPSYSCIFLGNCTTCSCLSASTSCLCGEDQGFIKVSCAAP